MKNFYNFNEINKKHPSFADFEPKTYIEYLKSAETFTKQHCLQEFSAALVLAEDNEELKVIKSAYNTIYPEIINALLKYAHNHPHATWKKIRRSLSVNYASLGLMHIAKKISGISNPVQPSDRKGKTGRARRAKYVSFDDFMLFFQDRIEAGQDMAAAFLYIGYYLGLRPAEISGLDYELDINTGKLNIIVPHVKNTAKGKRLPKYQRGIDRVLVVDYNKELMKHIDIATVASQSDKDRIRRQIRDLNKRYFPHRKQLINMYSLRYTFGADVKRAARHDPIEVSSKLGHKNTKSSYCYGNSRQSLGKKKVPEATMQTKQQVQVDDSHTLLSLRDKLEQASESQAQKTKQDLPRV